MARQLAVLAALAALLCVASALEFEVDDHRAEEDAREAFGVAVESRVAVLTKVTGQAVLKASMNRAWWGLTADVVEAFRGHKVDLASKVFQHAAAMKRQLSTLADRVASRKKGKHGCVRRRCVWVRKLGHHAAPLRRVDGGRNGACLAHALWSAQ